MKLRNKKTGKHGDYSIGTGGDLLEVRNYWDDSEVYQYDSIAKFYERWEDYAPAEPLIRDEKIREAVRKWAETNNINTTGIKVSKGSNAAAIIGWIKGRIGGLSIDFQTHMLKELEDGKKYTLAELCGEEEECES